jgi:RNA-directed DNA polymerase
MRLETPDKIRTLQRKLYCKAKAEPAFRFYLLYDKICREDILSHAYRLASANAGAPGVDGVTFVQIEAEGLDAWLASLREELVLKTYRPAPVRRVMIPKPGGGERPLGIPTIRDRVAQTAAKLVLEPIFEADFDDGAYGYRPGRSATDAIREVHRLICRGDRVAWTRSWLRADGWRHTSGSRFTSLEPLCRAIQTPCRTPPSHLQAPVSGHELGGV